MLGRISIVGIAVLAMAFAACSGGTTDADDPTMTPTQAAVPTATATPQPTNIPVAPTATPVVGATETPAGGGDDLVAQGKVLFERTAGGTGCAMCHGLDAQGNTVIGAPPNIGATRDMIWNALDTRAQMSYLVLTPDEVNAIAAYLAYLAEQQ